MAYSSWLCFAGTPIVDNCATIRRAQAAFGAECSVCVSGDCGCCEFLHQWDDPDAPAPWADPNGLDAFNFLGLLVTEITGLEPGKITREVAARASGLGGVLLRPAQAAPVITVTALLVAVNEAAAVYGLRWLTAILNSPCNGGPCSGSELIFYTACPTECDQPECADYRRTFFDVAMISSPAVLRRLPTDAGCGVIWEIEFQLSAGSPCQFSEPIVIATDQTFTPDTSDDCRFEWVAEPDCGPECGDPEACIVDPTCPPVLLPPRPGVLTTGCDFCDPWNLTTVCIDLPTHSGIGGGVPAYASVVPIVTISAGDNPLRATTVRFWPNPDNTDPALLDPCDSCTSISISRIPANSVLTIDGRTRKVLLECEGQVIDGSGVVSAGGGELPFVWPVIECVGVNWTACVETDADVAAANASVSISLAAREC
jgi:hypothetical protein